MADFLEFGFGSIELLPPSSKPWQHCVSVDAYRADEEPWRIERLWRLVGWVVAKDERGHRERILGLHDHKGILTVTWDSEPSGEARALIIEAWDAEFEVTIDHEWPGGECRDG